MSEEQVADLVADLDSGKWRVREKAQRKLSTLPTSQSHLLRRALESKPTMEQKRRLELALEAVNRGGMFIKAASLGDYDSARLLYVDGKGRAVLQPWKDGKRLAILLIVGSEDITTITLPSDERPSLCEAADGRLHMLCGEGIYGLSPGATELELRARLGNIAKVKLRLLAVWGDNIVIAAQPQRRRNGSLLMIGLATSASLPALPGREIASGLPVLRNDRECHPVAVGPTGRLWFLIRQDTGKTRAWPGWANEHPIYTTTIMRADGPVVTRLGEPTVTSEKPSIWPIGPDTAIVPVADHAIPETIFYHNGRVHPIEGNLQEIVEQHGKSLLEIIHDGVGFESGDGYTHSMLFRLSDHLYFEDAIERHEQNAGGTVRRCGLWHDGNWVTKRQEGPGFARDDYEPLINRLVALDIPGKRVLAYTDKWRTLRWLSMPGLKPGNNLGTCEKGWAWRWINNTHRPRFDGSWTMTPEAGQRWDKIRQERVAELSKTGGDPDPRVPYYSRDFAAFGKFQNGTFRVLDHSVYGSAIWEDVAGGVWQFHFGEVLVSTPHGNQVIPLDAGQPNQYRLAVESTDAVWVATPISLIRFVQEEGADGEAMWQAERTYRLPGAGVAFGGPWIAGDHMYYTSAGRLYYISLDELSSPAAH